jgi:aspartate/methionine/tyrosine aminotransferase
MNPYVSQRIAAVSDPVIPVMANLIAANPGTISMGQGVVGYPPPPAIWDHVETFRSQPRNHVYQNVDGIPQLREALRAKLTQENGIDCRDSEVIVTSGSNMAFLHVILAIADPGDDVIILSPYFFNHEMALRFANVHPLVVPSDANYLPDLDALQRAMTPRTRAIVTVSPNNPTGAVYPEAMLKAVNHLCASHGMYHISDEAYEYFTYDDHQHYSPASASGSTGHTISLFSFSKAYGFASWRIGYMLVPRHLYHPLLRIQDTNPICPPAISQFAALGLLESGVAFVRDAMQPLIAARAYCRQELQKRQSYLATASPSGAFYFYIKLRTGGDSMQIAKALIEQFKIAVVSGAAFGDESDCTFRVSYGAVSPEHLPEGIDRLMRGLHAHRGQV